MDLLLGIDAGTTSIKAGLFQPDGRCLFLARREYVLDTPAADRAELDPEVYWRSCRDAVMEVVKMAGAQADSVKALAVSSQGETLIPLDRGGHPLHPAIVWLDNRATREAEELKARYQPTVYKTTGIPEVVATWPACKILWLRKNANEVFSKTGKFLLVQDFLIHRLTGRFATDGSISCTTMYFDINRDDWWEPMLAELGITRQQLPEIVAPGSVIGNLTEEIARQLGLPGATLVVTGGMDQSVGAIGAGNVKPGIISETTGAALAIQATISRPDLDARKLVPVYVHSVPGNYLFVPVCPTAGMALKWFRDTFAAREMEDAEARGEDTYNLLTRLAEDVPPGSDGLILLPHLMGAFSPEPNLAARGSFTGFTLSHTRGHFVRALLEGVAFLLRQNLDLIRQAGLEVADIRSTGGGARSQLWNQIKADVCNLPVVIPENEETGLLGDAILAGVATGIFPSIETGCQAMIRLKDTYTPGSDASVYETAYRNFCELDQDLAGFYRKAYS